MPTRCADGRGSNLKAVSAKHDWPPVSPTLRRFVDWIASYTLAPRGMVARMAIRDPDRAEPERPRYGIRLTGNACERLTAARSRVILAAQGGFALPKGELAKQAGVSTGVIDALVDLEVLEAVALPQDSVAPEPDPAHAIAALSPTQAEAADRLGDAVRQGASASACWRASRARARPRSISRPWRRR